MARKRPSASDEQLSASSEEQETSSEEEEEESEGGEEADVTPMKNAVTLDQVAEKKAAVRNCELQSSKSSNVSASAATSKSSKKRPSQSDCGRESKRSKEKSPHVNANAEERAATGVDDSRKPFQRLWSDDDEIAILKGMIDYKAKKGSDPTLDMNAFHDFIRHSLHIDVSRSQVMDKVRRLKMKYKSNLERGKEGEEPKFNKPHEQIAFELSRKVWGAEVATKPVEPPKPNEIAPKKQDISNKSWTPLQLDGNAGTSDERNEYPWSFGKYFSAMGLPENSLNRGLESVDPAKREELKEEWKKLHMAELECFVSKMELAMDQAKLILEAYKSSCK